MTEWSSPWGTLWGAVPLVPSDRLLMFVRSPRLSAFVDVFGDRWTVLTDTHIAVAASFDLDNAVGDQLDRLGGILQRPRLGYGDDRYRTLVQIQAQLVLSSTTTTPTIMRIVELFTGYAPTMYADVYPMGYRIGAQLDEPTDAALLLQILREATAAAYEVEVVVSDGDAVIADYGDDPLDLDPSDIGDYSADPIDGAGTGAYSFGA